MNWTINGRHYDGFPDDDWQQLNNNPDDWPDWYEKRINSTLIYPLDNIHYDKVHGTSPGYELVNGEEMYFLFTGTSLILMSMEAHGWMVASPPAQYVDALKCFFSKFMAPEWKTDEAFQEWAYQFARNGLAHEGVIKHGGLDDKVKTYECRGKDNYALNPYTLFDAYKDAFQGMVTQIRNDSSDRGIRSVFNMNFKKRFSR